MSEKTISAVCLAFWVEVDIISPISALTLSIVEGVPFIETVLFLSSSVVITITVPADKSPAEVCNVTVVMLSLFSGSYASFCDAKHIPLL